VEGQWVLLKATDGDGVCGTACATMVAQFAMGAMVLGGCWLWFGAGACFRMWWLAWLRQYEFASGAEAVYGSVRTFDELIELEYYTLGLRGCGTAGV
jgi:hypothetical protein